MSLIRALLSGFVGATVLTAIHETVRRLVPSAPRMDLLGKEALAALLRAAGHEPPQDPELYYATLAGDIASNAVYYSLVGTGPASAAGTRGAVLGLLAGVGAIVLPKHLNLSQGASTRTTATAVMTVTLYLTGGAVAGAAYRALGSTDEER